MTASAHIYNAEGQPMAPCCDCRNNGIVSWYPVESMKARKVGNLTMHYCGTHYKARREAMRARARRMRK